jgi:hypothetical protein
VAVARSAECSSLADIAPSLLLALRSLHKFFSSNLLSQQPALTLLLLTYHHLATMDAEMITDYLGASEKREIQFSE